MEEIQSLVHSTLDRWVEMKEIALQNESHKAREIQLVYLKKKLCTTQVGDF